jgi:hypothetical protein
VRRVLLVLVVPLVLVMAGCSNGGPDTAAVVQTDKVICDALKQSPAEEQKAAHDPSYQMDYLIHLDAAVKGSGPDASTRKLRSEAATLATALKPLNVHSKALSKAALAIAVTCQNLGYHVLFLTAEPSVITSTTSP